jgi:hypothetical protein
MLCDSDILPMRFMHTDSSVVRLPDSLSSVNRIHESSKYLLRIVVNLPHYPDSLVNYTFVPLTAHSYTRITTRIGIYTKKPCQLSLRTIDLSFGIQNQYESVVTYPKELSTYPFASLTAISDSESLTKVNFGRLTPSSGNKEYPLQWKLRVDPSSGNMVVIRQTPPQWKL